MKSKRDNAPSELREQIRWAEGVSDADVKMMLLDGKSKTSCGCDVINEECCPHGNMGALALLMLQLSKQELDELRTKAGKKTKV